MAKEHVVMVLLAVGHAGMVADLSQRGHLLEDYSEIVASGVAYGVTLAMRHPEYARQVYLGLSALSVDFDKSVLAVVVDGLVEGHPLTSVQEPVG